MLAKRGLRDTSALSDTVPNYLVMALLVLLSRCILNESRLELDRTKNACLKLLLLWRPQILVKATKGTNKFGPGQV